MYKQAHILYHFDSLSHKNYAIFRCNIFIYNNLKHVLNTLHQFLLKLDFKGSKYCVAKCSQFLLMRLTFELYYYYGLYGPPYNVASDLALSFFQISYANVI